MRDKPKIPPKPVITKVKAKSLVKPIKTLVITYEDSELGSEV